MFNTDEIVVVSGTALPLVRESVHPRKTYKRENIIHNTQQTKTKRYDTNNINNTMETPAVPLSSFKVPEVGGKFVDKECIHRYVYACNHIKFTNRSITPTSESNKTKIGFDCKHVGCLFGLFFCEIGQEW